ncbi:hypothetical protein J4419_05375 [Candidatus Woesearchaeota archaeon]|nr:hypothetical protein [Candidatus Woesearchaeota archaeon]
MATDNADKDAQDKPFVLEGGKQVHSIRQLYDELEAMPDAVFQGHQQRKDFSNWIQKVYSEYGLARRLRHCTGKAHFKRELGTWMSQEPAVGWLRQHQDELLRDLLCFALGLIVGIVAMLLARL